MVTAMAAHNNLNRTLMALADPTRRAILRRLSHGEARVTELARPFPMSLNAVSKHIRALERARLVRRRRDGREHLLTFNPRPLDEAAAWIERHRAFWTNRLDALEAALRAEDRAAAKTHRKRKDHLDERQTARRKRQARASNE
jgi:DNA-binding transcriptional ArsR family regulator